MFIEHRDSNRLALIENDILNIFYIPTIETRDTSKTVAKSLGDMIQNRILYLAIWNKKNYYGICGLIRAFYIFLAISLMQTVLLRIEMTH